MPYLLEIMAWSNKWFLTVIRHSRYSLPKCLANTDYDLTIEFLIYLFTLPKYKYAFCFNYSRLYPWQLYFLTQMLLIIICYTFSKKVYIPLQCMDLDFLWWVKKRGRVIFNSHPGWGQRWTSVISCLYCKQYLNVH